MQIIALAGKTSTSKDTIARYIHEEYGISQVISYATRPIKAHEKEGLEHYFINDATMDEIVKDKSKLLAFVKFPKTGHRYCSTSDNLSEESAYVYIIDPVGILWLKENRPTIEVITIFLDLEEDVIKERALKRGDSIDVIEARLNSERELFLKFAQDRRYDDRIYTGYNARTVCENVDRVLSKHGIQKKLK